LSAGALGTVPETPRTITVMTRLMQSVIERLRAVPDAQQDQLAAFLLHELEQNERWGETSAGHADALAKLVDKVLADDDRGDCEPLAPERL